MVLFALVVVLQALVSVHCATYIVRPRFTNIQFSSATHTLGLRQVDDCRGWSDKENADHGESSKEVFCEYILEWYCNVAIPDHPSWSLIPCDEGTHQHPYKLLRLLHIFQNTISLHNHCCFWNFSLLSIDIVKLQYIHQASSHVGVLW